MTEDVVIELPPSLRGELKDPLGEIYTDAGELLAAAGEPLICVGDVVTYHVTGAGVTPALAIIDGKTKREADERAIEDLGAFEREIHVTNPAATLTGDMLDAIHEALHGGEATVIVVEGEEDLAALPVVVTAPVGASLVYGQPDEGMVLAHVDEALQRDIHALLSRMDGDHDAMWDALGVEVDLDLDTEE
ncbi:MAG: GTP-dependent dephospho-CoA kinase family protein [Haloarculaceae archaeon]